MTRVERVADQLVNRAWSAGLQLPPDQTLWEWSDEHRILASDSDDQGKYSSARTPYIRGIAECLSPGHPATDISIKKGSQLGLTTLGINWIGYIVHLMPAPVLITLPSEGVAREWSTQRLSQLVEETEVLRGRILDANKRRSGNTTFSKRFSNGYFMKIAWSSSAAKLRSTPAKWLLSDEVDGFDGDTDGEGDPLLLLNRRSTNFQGAKHFKISTPTDAKSSRIDREFKAGDQRFYFVSCPECGHFQVIKFGGLRWDWGTPQSVALRCIKCNAGIHEYHKTAMLDEGLWVATRNFPELYEEGFSSARDIRVQHAQRQMADEKKTSFHLNSFYSPIGWYSWEKAAEEWEAAHRNPSAQKVYVMTVMGECWNNLGEAPKWEVLYERRKTELEPGKAANGVLFLTAGVDVQADRLEYEIVGWGRDLRSWSVFYGRIDGMPTDPATWVRLEAALAKPIPHQGGVELPIWIVGVDSGAWAATVYSVVLRHQQPYVSPTEVRIERPGTWIPTKGGHSFHKLLEGVSSEDAAKKRGGLKVFTIGTSFAKVELYEWLNGKPQEVDGQIVYPAGYPEWPGYDQAYFQGITAERLTHTAGGNRKFVPEPGVRNEPLDIRVINRLCAHLMMPQRLADRERFWRRREREIAELVPMRQPAPMAALPAQPLVDEVPRKLRVPRPVYSEEGWI